MRALIPAPAIRYLWAMFSRARWTPPDDKDWVRVELTAGTIYDITLTGVESAQLQLLDSEGNHTSSPGAPAPSPAQSLSSARLLAALIISMQAATITSISGDYELSLVENTIPTGTYDEIADYLTDGFSELGGGFKECFPRRAWAAC